MDFSVLMLILLVVTGAIWGLDRMLLAPGRRKTAEGLRQANESENLVEKALGESVLVEYARAFFPVILVVFVLRAFIVEPFRIPSGSMMPGLLAGDFILVSKFSFGVRFPGLNVKMIDSGSPKRGDVMVFRFPDNPSVNYIKRTIGLPGDNIIYRNKRLFINGAEIPQKLIAPYLMRESGQRLTEMQRWVESMGGTQHEILKYGSDRDLTLEFQVPAGHYFVMGDNRDRSNDSRYWGYVPENNLIGKAFLIWFSWDMKGSEKWFGDRIMWNRIGTRIR
ncbi:MAG: signal peptidase I [Acidiferrobacterales bacterium]